MKTRYFLITAAIAALAALYMLVPACGSNNNNPAQTVPYGYGGYGYNPYGGGGVICQPGQVCPTGAGGVMGVPLIPTPAIANLSSGNGSTAILNFGGSNVIAGQLYSGPVNITGILNILPGGTCPPGTYQIQGQGQWAGGYGATVAKVVAQLQLNSQYGPMMAQINGLVYAGQDPNTPPGMNANYQYYLTGLFPLSCDPGGTAF